MSDWQPATVLLSVAEAGENGAFPTGETITYAGLARQHEDGWLVKYEERLTEEADDPATLVRLRVNPYRVKLLREGGYRALFHFAQDLDWELSYETPYGALPMTIRTREFACELGADGGEVRFLYDMAAQGGAVSRRKMRITWRLDGGGAHAD